MNYLQQKVLTMKARNTYSQTLVKASMGLFKGLHSFNIRFHWKFWKPLECLDGKVYFGRYSEWELEELDEISRKLELYNLRGMKG